MRARRAQFGRAMTGGVGRRGIVRGLAALALAAAMSSPAAAQIISSETPAAIRGMSVEQKLGQVLPLELEFIDDTGKKVMLRDWFDLATKPDGSKVNADGLHRPVVISLGYYECPVQCGLIRDKINQAMRGQNFVPGQDYKVLVFSFDSSETTEQAAAAKQQMIDAHDRWSGGKEPSAKEKAAFGFHTGTAESAKSLADGLGFPFRPTGTGDFSHASVIIVATPDGKISRYIEPFGSFMSEEKLRETFKLALLEASDGKIAKNLGDRIMSFCYMFDPNAGAYTLQAFRVMQIGGGLSLVGLVVLIGGMEVAKRVSNDRKRLARLDAANRASAGGVSAGGASAGGGGSGVGGGGSVGGVRAV